MSYLFNSRSHNGTFVEEKLTSENSFDKKSQSKTSDGMKNDKSIGVVNIEFKVDGKASGPIDKKEKTKVPAAERQK